MANRIFFESETSHYEGVGLFAWGATVVLPITWTPLLKLYCQGPKSVLPSWDQISTTKKAMRQLHLWNSYLRPWSKMGRLRSAKKWSRKIVDSDGFVLGCLDLTFHGQRHIFRVRRQPPCSGSLVCLGSNRSLANHADATVEVILSVPNLFSQAGTRSLQRKTVECKKVKLQFCR